MDFKVGDKVRIKRDCSGTHADEIYTLVYGTYKGEHMDELWAWEGGKFEKNNGGCHCQDNWVLVLPDEPEMVTKLRGCGFLKDTYEISQDGKDALKFILKKIK